MRYRQNTDFTGRDPCSQRRKAIHFFGNGSSAPGREVGAGGVSHSARNKGVLDRRLAERRRRKQVPWSKRSSAQTGPHRARGVPHNAERTATTETIVEFTQALVVALWEAFTVHRGSGAGEARLFLAPCLPRAAFGSIPGLRRQFRNRQTGICR